MSKLLTTIRNAPKRLTALFAILAAVVFVPAALFAWGPARDTYTIEHPADHVVFNSITNNPQYGDERDFVQIKESTAPNSAYSSKASLQAGKKYTVYMYYHNNAATQLNASGVGIAKDVTARAELPAVVAKGATNTVANGYISASNARPSTVWDDVTLSNSTAGDIALRMVPGSAKLHNGGKLNGTTLSDSIITTGAKIGYDTPGIVPGCNDYAGYITFDIVADQPNFTVSKQVRKAGESTWVESKDLKAGDQVEYLITYRNTGTTSQKDVVLKDTLPAGVSYVPGTTYVANSTNPNGLKLDAASDKATTSGVNIGNYAPGAAAYVKLTGKVAASDQLTKCGDNALVNVAQIQTNNGNKSDTATVTVPKECKPESKCNCDSMTVTQTSRTTFKFDTKYTAQNATVKKVTYVVRNAAGAEVYRGENATYTQTTPGKYTVQAILTVTIDGKDKEITGTNCKGSFEVKPEVKDITVCDLATKKVITIKETEFDATKHSKNLDDCKEVVKDITVCELATKKVITIKENEFDSSKHSKNLDDCKEVEVKKIEVCELSTKKVITIKEADFDATKHSKDLKDCEEVVEKIEVCELETGNVIEINKADFDSSKHSTTLTDCDETPEVPETPETPTELPVTGPTEAVLSVIALGSVIAGAGYYITSRRSL